MHFLNKGPFFKNIAEIFFGGIEMRHGFLSLIAATGMVGLMAIAANAGGMTALSNSSLANVSAKGISINQNSGINLSGNAGSHATGIVIANSSGSAVNDQVNLNAQLRVRHFALRQWNNGTAFNDIQVSTAPTNTGSGGAWNNARTNNNGHHGRHSLFNGGHHGWSWSHLIGNKYYYSKYNSSKTSNSNVNLSGSAQHGATGFVIANMASSAVNNQLNVNVQKTARYFNLKQWNNGTAINNVSAYGSY